MGRKKFRLQQSRHPETERVLYDHMLTRDNHRTLDRREVMDLVRGGEDSEVEFKSRLSNPEKIAAEIVAMANSGGGAILFGISDSCRVEGVDDPEQVERDLRSICFAEITPPVHPYIDKVAFDNGRRVVVLEFDDRRAPHMTRDQKFYIRVGSIKREADPEEITDMFRRYRPVGFELIPWRSADLDDLDESLIWSYVRTLFGEALKLPDGYPTATVLHDMQLVVETPDDHLPTIASLLLFGRSKTLERAFPRSRLIATRFSGDSVTDPIIEQTVFTGNLGSLHERAEGFLRRYVDLVDQPPARQSAERGVAQRRAAYPRAALLEAVTNALVHRDYSVREDGVRVMIFDRRIEIANPSAAKPHRRPTIETYGVSIPNNPRLKSFFKNAAYGVTTFDGGLPMIRREAHRFTRRDIKLTSHPGEFKLEIPGA